MYRGSFCLMPWPCKGCKIEWIWPGPLLTTYLNWINNLKLYRNLCPFTFGIKGLRELSINLEDQHHDSCLSSNLALINHVLIKILPWSTCISRLRVGRCCSPSELRWQVSRKVATNWIECGCGRGLQGVGWSCPVEDECEIQASERPIAQSSQSIL